MAIRQLGKNKYQLIVDYYDAEGNLFFEPGEFDIMLGPNSRDVQTKRINVK